MNGISQLGARFAGIAVITATLATMTACSLVPDLAPESLAANRDACNTVSSVWTALTSAIQSGDLTDSATALEGLPTQLQAAIDTSRDANLDEALSALKAQLDALATTAVPDVAQLASAGAALATRCTVFGVTPDLTMPGM